MICKGGLLLAQYGRGSVSLAFSHKKGTVHEVKTYNTYMMATSSAQPSELKDQQPSSTISRSDTSVQKVDRSFVGFVEGHKRTGKEVPLVNIIISVQHILSWFLCNLPKGY